MLIWRSQEAYLLRTGEELMSLNAADTDMFLFAYMLSTCLLSPSDGADIVSLRKVE
jgi:hypothetical protein